MNPDSLDDPLEICLQRLKQGAGLEEVLAEVPEQANELRPLLLAAVEVRRLNATLVVPQAAQNRSRARFLATAPARPSHQNLKVLLFALLHHATAGLILVGIVAAVLLGTGLGSAAALPGDVFYPVKLIVEQMQINLVQDPPARLEMEENFDNRRVNEVIRLNMTQRKQQVSFGGLLVLTNHGEWQVGGLTLSFPPNYPLDESLIGAYVQVKGLSDDAVVEVQELFARRYQWSGILQSVDLNTWVVSGIRLALDDLTQVIGRTPRVGAPVNVSAIRLADDLYQALFLEVGVAPISTLGSTRLPAIIVSPTHEKGRSEAGETGLERQEATPVLPTRSPAPPTSAPIGHAMAQASPTQKVDPEKTSVPSGSSPAPTLTKPTEPPEASKSSRTPLPPTPSASGD